jgi:hypothetical protein
MSVYCNDPSDIPQKEAQHDSILEIGDIKEVIGLSETLRPVGIID